MAVPTPLIHRPTVWQSAFGKRRCLGWHFRCFRDRFGCCFGANLGDGFHAFFLVVMLGFGRSIIALTAMSSKPSFSVKSSWTSSSHEALAIPRRPIYRHALPALRVRHWWMHLALRHRILWWWPLSSGEDIMNATPRMRVVKPTKATRPTMMTWFNVSSSPRFHRCLPGCRSLWCPSVVAQHQGAFLNAAEVGS